MLDCQVISTSSFKSRRTGETYFNADVFIPSLNFVLPLMSDKPFTVGSKGKVALGYTTDRRSLRASDFVPSA